MNLHYPISLMISSCNKLHKCHLKFHFFFSCDAFTCQCFFENHINFLFCSRCIHYILQRMVWYRAAHRSKEIHSVQNSFLHSCKIFYFNSAYFRKSFHIICIFWFFQIHSFIWTPCWKYLNFKSIILCQFFMPFQRIYRIICSTD